MVASSGADFKKVDAGAARYLMYPTRNDHTCISLSKCYYKSETWCGHYTPVKQVVVQNRRRGLNCNTGNWIKEANTNLLTYPHWGSCSAYSIRNPYFATTCFSNKRVQPRAIYTQPPTHSLETCTFDRV